MATEGLSVRVAGRVLGVSEAGYSAWRKRPPLGPSGAARLADRPHSRGPRGFAGHHGARRVQAELVLAQGISVGHQAVERLMLLAGIQGLSGRPRYRKSAPHATAADRVGRQFAREAPDRLWVTDIERHEALFNRAVMKGHRLQPVAADRRS
jgi:putative transposase